MKTVYQLEPNKVSETYETLKALANTYKESSGPENLPDTLSALDRDCYLISHSDDTIINLSLKSDFPLIQKIYEKLISLDEVDGRRDGKITSLPTEAITINQPFPEVDAQQITDYYQHSVFGVYDIDPVSGAQGGGGTGWLVAKTPQADGSFIYQVLTNSHVVLNEHHGISAAGFYLQNTDDSKRIDGISVISVDYIADLALLEFRSKEDWPTLSITSQSLQPFETVVEIGNTKAQGVVGITGEILETHSGMSSYSLTYKDNYSFPCYILHSDGKPGNSGSPILNSAHKVAAMHHAGKSVIKNDPDGQYCILIPGEVVAESYQRLLAGRDSGGVTYGDWGFYPMAISSVDLPLGTPNGVYVAKTTPSGPMEKSGIKPGEIITEVTTTRGKKTLNIHDEVELANFLPFMLWSSPSETVTLTIFSPTTQQTRTVQLTPQNKLYKPASVFQTSTGFSVTDITEFERNVLGWGNIQGVRVLENHNTSDSDVSLLHSGMAITTINDQPATSVDQFEKLYSAAHSQGQNVTLTAIYTPETDNADINTGDNHTENGGVGSQITVTIKPR